MPVHSIVHSYCRSRYFTHKNRGPRFHYRECLNIRSILRLHMSLSLLCQKLLALGLLGLLITRSTRPRLSVCKRHNAQTRTRHELDHLTHSYCTHDAGTGHFGGLHGHDPRCTTGTGTCDRASRRDERARGDDTPCTSANHVLRVHSGPCQVTSGDL